MPDKVTYYAVVDDLSSRERPAGVFRRTYTEDGGRSDEAFTRDLTWEFSPALISAERGDLQNEFIEITEDEANQIVERIRAEGDRRRAATKPATPTRPEHAAHGPIHTCPRLMQIPFYLCADAPGLSWLLRGDRRWLGLRVPASRSMSRQRQMAVRRSG